MILSLLISTALSLSAHAQSETPAAGGKAPAIMPVPANPSDAKFKGDECVAEAKTANCVPNNLGKELLTCMMNYKRAHHEFSISPTCRVGIQKWHMAQMQMKNSGKPMQQTLKQVQPSPKQPIK